MAMRTALYCCIGGALSALTLMPASASCPDAGPRSVEDLERHERSIASHRRLLEQAFREPQTSPLQAADLPAFEGLEFYPIDPAFQVAAEFRASDSSATFELPTFNGERQKYREYGQLQFCLGSGEPLTLTAFQRQDAGDLGRLTIIAPFRDRTNGTDTYSGGRYLKFLLPLPNPMRVDFNRAVNPLCAYNPTLPCPIPPRQNWLDIAVPVGEKDYVPGTAGSE